MFINSLMEDTNQEILDKLNQIQIDIEFIKENIGDDGELSDWAKNELAEAREESEDEYTSLEDLKKEIENDL